LAIAASTLKKQSSISSITPLDELPLVLQRLLQPSEGSLWVTESGVGQISQRTGPKSDLLLDPQLPVGFGADVAAKVAAAGLHPKLRSSKVDLALVQLWALSMRILFEDGSGK
jgi:hypothetical protein